MLGITFCLPHLPHPNFLRLFRVICDKFLALSVIRMTMAPNPNYCFETFVPTMGTRAAYMGMIHRMLFESRLSSTGTHADK